MCDPMTAAVVGMAALGGASAAANVRATNKASERGMQDAVNQQILSQNMAAQESQDNAQATGMAMAEKAKAHEKSQAALRVSQAESGLTGISPLRDIANTYMQQSYDMSTLTEQGSSTQRNTSREMQGQTNAARSSYNDAKGKGIGGFQAGLQIAGSTAQGGLQGYTAGKAAGF